MAALVLLLAGVPAEAVADDYAQSHANLAPFYTAWRPSGAPGDITMWHSAPRAAMLAVCATLEQRRGGAGAYVRASGLSDIELAHLRGH